MMWWNHGAWGAGDWLSMSVMMLAFWALVIALILWLVRSTRNSENRLTISPMQRADEVLAERFAGGEINQAEFTRRRASLHPDHHPFVCKPTRRPR